MLWKIRGLLPSIILILIDKGLTLTGIIIPWLGYIFWGLAVVFAIVYVYTLVKDKQKAKTQDNVRPVSQPSRQDIILLKVKQKEPRRYPHVIFEIVLYICCTFFLLFSVLLVYAWVSHKAPPPSIIDIIMLAILFIALPIWVIEDTLFTRIRYYHADKSSVAKEKDLIFKGDIDTVFDGCRHVLENKMHTQIINLDSPRHFQGKICSWIGAQAIVEIKLSQLKGNRVKIHVLSDSRFRTVKFDFGVNQKNIDKFERLLIAKLGQDEQLDETTDTKSVALRATKGSSIGFKDSNLEGYDQVASADDQSKIEFDHSNIKRESGNDID